MACNGGTNSPKFRLESHSFIPIRVLRMRRPAVIVRSLTPDHVYRYSRAMLEQMAPQSHPRNWMIARSVYAGLLRVEPASPLILLIGGVGADED